jgi:hypothetical protein
VTSSGSAATTPNGATWQWLKETGPARHSLDLIELGALVVEAFDATHPVHRSYPVTIRVTVYATDDDEARVLVEGLRAGIGRFFGPPTSVDRTGTHLIYSRRESDEPTASLCAPSRRKALPIKMRIEHMLGESDSTSKGGRMPHLIHIVRHGGLGVVGFLIPYLFLTPNCTQTTNVLGRTSEVCTNVFGQAISAGSTPGAWPWILAAIGFVAGRIFFGSWFGWGEQ